MTPSPKPLLTTEELADHLGIGKDMVRQLAADPDAELPRLRLGDRLLFPAALIPSWIERRAMRDTPAAIGIPRTHTRKAHP